MKKTLILYFFFTIISGHAQKFDAQATVGTVTSMNDIFTKHLKSSSGEEVTGNPFLFSEWNRPGVVYSGENAYPLKEMNYNILSDDIVILRSKDSVFTFNKVKIDSFSIHTKRFKKYNTSFYEVLYNGSEISLLKKYDVEIIEGMFNPMDGTKEKSRFKTVDDFYIEKEKSVVKFIPSKKSITSIFKDKSPSVKKFIKQNKLSLKKENDLIEIFKFYNQKVE